MRAYTIEYTREEVEKTMEAMWNGGDAFIEARVESDAPKSESNPARANTQAARLVDVDLALKTLNVAERGDLYLHYGRGWTHAEIAAFRDEGRSTITERLAVQVGLLVDELNGTTTWGKQ